MTKKDKTICNNCGTNLPIKHIFTKCYQYANDVEIHNMCKTLDAAFELNPFNNKNLIKYLNNQICLFIVIDNNNAKQHIKNNYNKWH